MKVGFIGAGKVGFSLGKYFKEHGVDVTGYYSRLESSAQSAANFTKTKKYTLNNFKVYFIHIFFYFLYYLHLQHYLLFLVHQKQI